MSLRVTAVWGVLMVLVGTILGIEMRDYIMTQHEDRPGEQVSRDPHVLVPVPLEQVGAVEIAHAGMVHRFERDAAGAWFYHGAHAPSNAAHAHQADPVMAKRIDTALQGFGRTRIERILATGQALQSYGLANPQMLILVYRPKALEPLLQVAVGDVAPDTFSRYVMVVGRASVVTIANYQIENLLGLIQLAVESGQGQRTVKPS